MLLKAWLSKIRENWLRIRIFGYAGALAIVSSCSPNDGATPVYGAPVVMYGMPEAAYRSVQDVPDNASTPVTRNETEFRSQVACRLRTPDS